MARPSLSVYYTAQPTAAQRRPTDIMGLFSAETTDGTTSPGPPIEEEIILASPTASVSSKNSDNGWFTTVAEPVDDETKDTPEEPVVEAPKPWEVIAQQLVSAQSSAKNLEETLSADIETLKKTHAAEVAALHLENQRMREQLGNTASLLGKQVAVLGAAAAETKQVLSQETDGVTKPKASWWIWRMVCPSWFTGPRETLANSRLSNLLAVWKIREKVSYGATVAANPTTKLGWAIRGLVATVGVAGCGHWVRTHHHVLLALKQATASRSMAAVAVITGVITKKRILTAAAALIGSTGLVYLMKPPTPASPAAEPKENSPAAKWRRLAQRLQEPSATVYNKARSAVVFTASPTTKLGMAVRGLFAMVALFAGGRFVRVHHHVLMRPVRAVQARLPRVPRVRVSFGGAAPAGATATGAAGAVVRTAYNM